MRLTRTFFAALLFSAVSAVGQTWSVQSATYGVGTKQQDVTATVRQLVRGPNFQVSNKDLKIDPAPGQDKTLRIVARDPKGATRTFTYQERSTVDTKTFGGTGANGASAGFDPNNNALRILQGSYRQTGATQFTDVTQRLQSMVKNNRLQVVVNNRTMGVNTAPGKPTQLVVRYQFGGRLYVETVEGNSELVLPSPNARALPVN
jgi:hypothetical protein